LVNSALRRRSHRVEDVQRRNTGSFAAGRIGRGERLPSQFGQLDEAATVQQPAARFIDCR
jgi:hypothetical protein